MIQIFPKSVGPQKCPQQQLYFHTTKSEEGNGESLTALLFTLTEPGHNSAEAREGGWLRSPPTECHYTTMEEGRRKARKIIPVPDETKLNNCNFNTQLSKISDVELDVIHRIWRKVMGITKQPTVFQFWY